MSLSFAHPEEDHYKDDDSPPSRVTFGLLALWSVVALLQALRNVSLLWRAGRFKNSDLVSFYLFSILTFIIAICFFLDPIIKYPNEWYELLMAFIAYTFACAGISYLSNLLLSILIDMGKRRWFYTDQKLRRMRFIIHLAVCMVNIGIITQFIWCYIKYDQNNPLNVAGVYYGAFVLVCVVHVMQIWHIHSTIKNPDFEKRKIIILFAVLSISYLARAILNTFQPSMKELQLYKWPDNYGWCAFIIGFYGIELFIPLQLLFYYQFQSNKIYPMGKDLFNTITTVSNEYDCGGVDGDGSVKVSFLPNCGQQQVLAIQNRTLTKSPQQSPRMKHSGRSNRLMLQQAQLPTTNDAQSDERTETMSFKEASPNVDSHKKATPFDELNDEGSSYGADSSAIPLKQSEMYHGGLLMTNPPLAEGTDVGSLAGDFYEQQQHHNVSNLHHRLFQKLRESHINNIDRQSVVNQITQGLQQNERSADYSFNQLLPTAVSTQQQPQRNGSSQSNIMVAEDHGSSLNHPSVTE